MARSSGRARAAKGRGRGRVKGRGRGKGKGSAADRISDDELADDMDSDSSDDDSEDDDEELPTGGFGGPQTTKNFLARLRDDIKESPFDAELHVALIGALREKAELDDLREARRCAASRVALPEDLWIEWIDDERRIADDSDFAELDALHRSACAALPTSAKLWLTLCSFRRDFPEGRGQETTMVRAAYEEALEALGLHPAEGQEIWADFREYEDTLLAKMGKDEERVQQVQRIRTLFYRQLALPLPGADRLKDAHQAFEGGLEPEAAKDPSAIAKASALSEEAAALWKERAPLEQRLAEASRPMVSVGAVDEKAASPAAITLELLAAEEATEEQSRIYLGHLRATQAAPKELSRWVRFADFASESFGSDAGKKVPELLERALRHHGGVAALWRRTHEALEAAGAPLVELRAVVDRGVFALRAHGSDGNAWAAEVQEFYLQHADACRRAATAAGSAGTADANSMAACSVAVASEVAACWKDMRSVMELALGLSEGNEELAVHRCQALLRWLRLEAYGARDVAATLAVGNQLMALWGSYFNVWSTFICALRCCTAGSPNNGYDVVRDLYQRAISQVTDYPDQARADYLDFERDCGSFKSWCKLRNVYAPVAQLETTHTTVEESNTILAEEGQDEDEADEEDKQIESIIGKRPAAQAKRGGGRAAKRQRKLERQQQQLSVPPDATMQGQSSETPNTVATNANKIEAAKQGETDVRMTATVDEATGSAKKAKVEVDAPVATASIKPDVSMSRTVEEVPNRVRECEIATGLPMPAATDCVAGEPGRGIDETSENLSAEATPAPLDVKKTTQLENAAPEPRDDSTKVEEPGDAKDVTEQVSKTEPEAKSEQSHELEHNPHGGSHYHQKRLADGASSLRAEDEGNQTIYVSNLDWSVDSAQLYRLFGELDGIKDVRLVCDFMSRSKGYAYIDFQTPQQVGVAVEKMNGQLVNNRIMKVARSLPTKSLYEEKIVFVTNISSSAKEADIRAAFAVYGEIREVRVPIDADTKEHKGYAYVEYADAAPVQSALNAAAVAQAVKPPQSDNGGEGSATSHNASSNNGVVICGQRVQVSLSIPMKDHRHQTAAPRKDLPQRCNQRLIVADREARVDPVKQAQKNPTTLYVKDLAFDVDDEKLRKHFSQCGEVVQILVVRNANGRSRGFGFVELRSEEQAQAALGLTGSMLCGREIVVSRSQRAITQKKSNQEKPSAGLGKAVDHMPKEGSDDEELNSETKGKGRGKGKGKAKDKSKHSKEGVKASSREAPRVALRETKIADATAKDGAAAPTADVSEKNEEAAPMSNADFRLLLLGGK